MKEWLKYIIIAVILIFAIATQGSIGGKLNIQEHKWWLLLVITVTVIIVIQWLKQRKSR